MDGVRRRHPAPHPHPGTGRVLPRAAPLAWWSLALLIAVSIVVGQLLRLGPNLIEVPISAMLVLAVASADQGEVGIERIYETMIGAAVGVVVNILFPPAVRRYDAAAKVERFAGRIARILDVAADDLSAGPVGIFRSVVDGVRAGSVADTQDEYSEDVQEAFAVLLRDLANCFRSYGQMLQVNVEYDSPAKTAQVEQALTDLREARARTADMLLMGAKEDPEYWELNVALLATVERVLRELDIEEYARERAAYLIAEGPVLRQTHEAAERWRRFGRAMGP